MPGNLFTNYFLTEGIRATTEWRTSISDSTAFAAFRDGVRQSYGTLSSSEGPNEAVTEQELIRPVLKLLGWADYLPQQGTTRNEDIPDYLLFTDAASKERAAGRANPDERFRDAIVVEESKRFGLSLDARDREKGRQSRTPHGQILRYLSTADIESESRNRWGFLTNGGLWRLYDYRARPRATGYFEADLGEMLESGGEDGLRLFYLLFRRDSFTPQQGATTSFLEAALARGRRYEEKVAQDLSSVVFERVFPKLVQALADATGEDLSRVRHAALILLYRLLFVLYAEDRGLLPVNDRRYEDYGLRKPVRDHVAHRMQGGGVFSASASSYYDHLMTLFRQIDEGDESIGLPPYNGGLFASEAAPLLKAARLTDKIVGDIIYDLSHTETEGTRHFVNYRDMSVQQLGSIYERLLEREPVRDGSGGIAVRPNSYARKDSGHFASCDLVGGVYMPVNRGKQRELLTGLATRECRIGLSDPSWVEANDVEMRYDLIRELSPRNAVDELNTTSARTTRIHEQIAYPFLRRRGPVHIDRNSDAAGLGVPVVRGDFHKSALELE